MSNLFPFQYYVFSSQVEEPTEIEGEVGVYLVGAANSRCLQQFFDSLYDGAGIGISTSDDEVIAGEAKLTALSKAVEDAMRDTQARPAEWPVVIGYKLDADTGEVGAPIVETASRAHLLRFLEGVSWIASRARESGGYVHFCGGW
jgi:hypothetical protein